jgi:GH15 family glucan-1,4-alpha-glucosidase
MPLRLEEYALIGDCHTAALVGLDGSIDWLCLPRFDSGACFAALLGTPDHGRWIIAPSTPVRSRRRRYRDGSLVLETQFETDGGAMSVIDFMPFHGGIADVIRIVEGTRGEVAVCMELILRPDYGSIVPWVQHFDGGIEAIAGPDRLRLRAPVPLKGRELKTTANFTVRTGDRLVFDLTWFPSNLRPPPPVDPEQALAETDGFWREWSTQCAYIGPWRDDVIRSLITLKALTYAPTGGLVAAPTTSLPERLGGVRNWDYRYCWLRDATFTLMALLHAGYRDEARAWREWLLRAAAGLPSQLHIMYGIAGERRLPELELPWLPGYEGSAPVRTGNAAYTHYQFDVYGEVLDAMYQSVKSGLDVTEPGWNLQRALLEFLESSWDEPDNGIWEVRGPRRHFTHSKMMAWVAVDRAVKAVESFGVRGPVDQWRTLRDRIHAQVCREGFDPDLNAFSSSTDRSCWTRAC